MPTQNSVPLMDSADIGRSLKRIGHEIIERNKTLERLALVGIRTRGVPLAHRLSAILNEIAGSTPPTGVLDINLYRDDLSRIEYHPVLKKTEIPFELDETGIVLVDDVLFTGRTIRAALDGLMDLGRPRRVWLSVLVDRGGRELPICPDHVALDLSEQALGPGEHVEVCLQPADHRDAVVLRNAHRSKETRP